MVLLERLTSDPVTFWSRAHGHVSLEIEGNFASMGLDPDVLYRRTLTA